MSEIKAMTSGDFGRIVDNYGWQAEYGASDRGDFIVRVWRGQDSRKWRTERHDGLPDLFEMAVEYVERRSRRA